MTIAHIGINYDGKKQSTYDGVELCWIDEKNSKKKKKLFNSKKPPQDFLDAVIFAVRNYFGLGMYSSSVDNFTINGNKFGWSINHCIGEYMFDYKEKDKEWHSFNILPKKGKKRKKVLIQSNGRFLVIENSDGDYFVHTPDGDIGEKTFKTSDEAINFITNSRRKVVYL